MGDAMKFVFCEGSGDQLVIQSLARHLNLEVTVETTGGKDNLPNFLKSLQTRPEFARQQVETMAILRDADRDAAAAFQSAQNFLRQSGFPAPDVNGTFSNTPLRVGVFIVGVNGVGMIEDVCLNSVSDLPEFSCVDSYFACIAERSARSNSSSKAKVRVWMASHDDYDYRVGKAAEKGYWPWASPAFDPLKNFLKAL